MDWYIYKSRHVVENVFARLKRFRGIATRFDKLKGSYASGVALAWALIWLKYECSTDSNKAKGYLPLSSS